ncbi:MAG: glycosyltransferase [Flavobacteriaceae bacterium]|nr:glycosyltransferase [Flavobacteriaceae bacterium]
MKKEIRVLQLIDSLDAGGAERMAVNIANGLLGRVKASHLCVSRKEGILKDTIHDEVGYCFLNKKCSIDIRSLRILRQYTRKNKINIIHAHSSSFFLAILLKLSLSNLKIVWHDHYGKSEHLESRSKTALIWCSLLFSQVFSVNEKLEQWAKDKLKCKHVLFLSNIATLNKEIEPQTRLKGSSNRILCLANLRPQKDFENLLKAFRIVVESFPDWTLHCVGKDFEDDYASKIYRHVTAHNLSKHVFFYGSCSDISHIMSQCDIGVIASESEGLPLALLEYGLGELAVVTTDVGDCKLVVQDAINGILVKAKDEKQLADGLMRLIGNKELRLKLSRNLKHTITHSFSIDAISKSLLSHYNLIFER